MVVLEKNSDRAVAEMQRWLDGSCGNPSGRRQSGNERPQVFQRIANHLECLLAVIVKR